jgi:hypothetical protein
MKLILLIIVLITLVNCTREYNCGDEFINLGFINYTIEEVDTLELKKFKLNSNFQTVEKSILLVNGNNCTIYKNNDTCTVFIKYDTVMQMMPGSDWQIKIASSNESFKISNIISEQKTQKCNSYNKTTCVCFNRIYSLEINGVLKAFSRTYNYWVYLSK